MHASPISQSPPTSGASGLSGSARPSGRSPVTSQSRNLATSRSCYQADGRNFDSREEIDFYYWLLEARSAGLIRAWSYQPHTFELAPKVTVKREIILKTKTKIEESHLLHPCVYTPDFALIPGDRFHLISPYFHRNRESAWIDVKGTYSLHNDAVKFSLLQKWMFQKFGVYVNKIIPVTLFEKTFVPRRSAYNKNGTLRSCYTNCRTLSAFLNHNQTLL